MRMGVGQITLIDFDSVEWSNLPRQPYLDQDIGNNKALCLARILEMHRTNPNTEIHTIPMSFQNANTERRLPSCDIAYVGVDNDQTRAEAAQYFWATRVPTIFSGINRQSNKGYVFVQQPSPEQPCLACLFPGIETSSRQPGCAGMAAEVPLSLAGIALYALESLVMERERSWDYFEVSLASGQNQISRVRKKTACTICGHPNSRRPPNQG
jgi:sulfur carrier protein ThiS adenylyltransferase